MKRKSLEKYLGIFGYVFMFFPFFFLRTHHDCKYDECLRIFYNDKLGMCIEKAIDDMYLTIAVIWFGVIYGGAMVLSKCPNSTSPFVIIILILAVSIYGSFVDPSKWLFVASLSPSVIVLILSLIFDKKQ